jgi:predicted SnoaL-like aldol condensation-catalyzing enzyme
MKQFPLVLLLLISISSYEQQPKKHLKVLKDSSWSQKNLEAAHIVTKAFTTGDISQIDIAVTPNFIDHTGMGDAGRDSLKAMIIAMHIQFPDIKNEIIKEMADNDYAFLLVRSKGTSNGEMGIPAGPFEMNEIEVLKFKNGKITEHWAYLQFKDIMKMMPQQK